MSAAFDPDLYMRAWRFAAEAHGSQTMPTTPPLPYVVHVGAVAMEVIAALAAEHVDDPNLAICCALLHDTIEDTDTTWDDIEKVFGAAVANGVAALSKNALLPKADQMPDSLRRIKAAPREVAMVKLADRIVNMQPPPKHWSIEKCAAYRQHAQEIIDALGSSSPALGKRLSRKILSYLPRGSHE